MKVPEMAPLIVRPREARRLLSCSQKFLYQILGELESFKDGRSPQDHHGVDRGLRGSQARKGAAGMIQMETPGRQPGGEGRFQNHVDGPTISRNDLYFDTWKPIPYRNRAWWQAEYHRLCSDWPAVVGLAIEIMSREFRIRLRARVSNAVRG